MTAVHILTPVQRSGSGAASARSASRTPDHEALEVLRAAEGIAGGARQSCEGSSDCGRAGKLTVVTEDGTTSLCGLHAMNVVFSTADGPVALVKPRT